MCGGDDDDNIDWTVRNHKVVNSRLSNRKSVVRFEVFTAVTMKNGVFWVVTPCGSCKNRRFGGTWRLFHRVTKIGELGTTQAATSNRRTLRSPGMLRRVALVRTEVSEELSVPFIRVTKICDLGTTLAVTSIRRTLRRNFFAACVPPKRRFLKESHGVTSQKTPFFIVTAVKTSNLTQHRYCSNFVSRLHICETILCYYITCSSIR
jgi:hypothetical protein